MIINRITKRWLEDSELKLITMEEGQFGTRKRKILKMMALKRNIAKGTTDPRVEFILPKSYCKFKHKS